MKYLRMLIGKASVALDTAATKDGLDNVDLIARARNELKQLVAENDKLRAIIADSDLDCIYCGLSRKDIAKCPNGFPGCARGDDLTAGCANIEPPK